MLIDADRKYLLNSVSDKEARQHWMYMVGISILAVGGIIHLVMSSIIAHSRGETLLFVYQRWTEGFDVQAQYAGSLVKAIDELTDGLLGVGSAIILAIVVWRRRLERNRIERIISALKHSGSW